MRGEIFKCREGGNLPLRPWPPCPCGAAPCPWPSCSWGAAPCMPGANLPVANLPVGCDTLPVSNLPVATLPVECDPVRSRPAHGSLPVGCGEAVVWCLDSWSSFQSVSQDLCFRPTLAGRYCSVVYTMI